MSEGEMLSLLEELVRREEAFCGGRWDDPRFSETDIYSAFLQDPFIQENHLEQVYYAPLPKDVVPLATKGVFELEEAYMILSGINVTLCKQFNFHFGRLHRINCFELVWVMKGGADFYLGQEKIPLRTADQHVEAPEHSAPAEDYYNQVRLYIKDHYRTARLEEASQPCTLVSSIWPASSADLAAGASTSWWKRKSSPRSGIT